MKVVVHDRAGQIPAGLRAYAEGRLERVARHFDRVVDAEIEFNHAARREGTAACMVQIVVHMDGRKHPLAQARETTADARSALDLALDKVDRQVVRLKEKIKIERKRPEKQPEAPAAVAEQAVAERIRVRLRPQSLEDARRALDSTGQAFYVYLDEDSGEVHVAYRRADGRFAVIEPVVS